MRRERCAGALALIAALSLKFVLVPRKALAGPAERTTVTVFEPQIG